jgi:SAM-dependent methyltransferase
MSLELHRRAELSAAQIAGLEKAMAAFYQSPPPSYYQWANQAAGQYNIQEQPFHCDLAGRAFSGATVLEVGCGTAHLCPYVEKNGGIYTGLDHSPALLADNRRRFPHACFFPTGAPPAETFDLVASLYTLEHVVDPPAYLEQLWAFCRPGGLIGIICPEFVDCPGSPPSLYFGKTARRLREKLRTFSLGDVCAHLMAAAPGAFWINLRPRELHGAEHSIDADAVHLTRLKDMTWFYRQKGAEILQSSDKMSEIPPVVLRHNCYLLVRKPRS